MKHRSSCNLKSNLKIRLPRDYPWKVLSALADDHRYCLTDDDYSRVATITRNRDLAAYEELSRDWGAQSINPNDTSHIVFRAKYQIASLLKKFRFPSDNSIRKTAAIKKFIAAEEVCESYNREGYKSLVSLPWGSDEIRVFTYARSFLRRLLGSGLPSAKLMTYWSRHGPGSNLDTSNGYTSLYDKYSNWPYSCTNDAIGHARSTIADDERWLGALEDDYRVRFSIPKHEILNQETFWATVISPVDSNRITFVPKNAQTDRSIAIEPSLNLYLQLGVDGFIRRRLKRWGVDLDCQKKNQRLALEGSRHWRSEDPFVTLDLAAASDTISLKIVEVLCPSAWYQYLLDLRSPCGDLEGEKISYSKISSMGNGYTFALESAIFAAIVYGAMKVVRGHFDQEEMAVFGDDLIVRRSVSPLLIKMLNLCGFTVNSDKSFFEGPFRESCGADWFNGTSVRPVFLTQQPTQITELWNDYNRIQRILFLSNLLWDSKTCSLIDHWIPPIFRSFQGPYSDTEFDSYKHVPLPQGKYKRGLWDFDRLVLFSKQSKRGRNFLFRKLMSPLRQFLMDDNPSWFSKPWYRRRLSADGSVFTLTDANSVEVCVSPSQTSYWSGEYSTLHGDS